MSFDDFKMVFECSMVTNFMSKMRYLVFLQFSVLQ